MEWTFIQNDDFISNVFDIFVKERKFSFTSDSSCNDYVEQLPHNVEIQHEY